MKFKRTYHYFVSYMFKDSIGNVIVGDCEILIDHKIKSFKDIEKIRSFLSKNNNVSETSFNISNWKFLRKSYK